MDAPAGLRWLSRPGVYAALCVAVLLVRVPSWRVSLINPDEYAFILAGREVLHGHLPYVTFFDNKPAGVSVLLAAVMGLLGPSLLAVRAFGAGCVLAAAILLYEIVRLTARHRLEAAAAGLLYIAYSTLFGGTATMTEIMLAPFSCLGILLFARVLVGASGGAAARWLMLGGGLAFGLAVWIKTVPIVPGAGVGGAVILHGVLARRVAMVESALRGLLLAFGLVLPTLATALVFAGAGSFAAFYYANLGFMAVYVAPDSAKYMVLHLATIAAGFWPLLLMVAAGAWLDAADLLRRRAIPLGAVLAYAWLATEIVASAGPLRMYEHYFLMPIPPLAILAARLLVRCLAGRAPAAGSWQAVGAAAVMVIALVPVVPLIRQDAIDVLKFPDPQRTTSAAIARLLPADDRTLLVLSYDYMADYLYTGAPVPGRVSINAHLFNQTNLVAADPLSPLRRLLDRNPNVILVDYTYLGQTASAAQRAVIDGKLACCYRDAANLGEFWKLAEGGDYHVSDVHLYQRK